MAKDKDFSSVLVDKPVSLVFKHPSQSVLAQADFTYKKEFAKALRAGLITNAEASKLLRDRGIDLEEHGAKETELRAKIYEIEARFEGGEVSEEDGGELYLEVKKLRAQLAEHLALTGNLSDNTAESVAADTRVS